MPQTLNCRKTNSQMSQDKLTQSKNCSCLKMNITITKMFQPQFHYQKGRNTQVSESTSKSQSETRFLLQHQCHGHNQIGTIQEKRMFQNQHWSKTDCFRINGIQDHNQITLCLRIRSIQNHNQNISLQNRSLSNDTIKNNLHMFRLRDFHNQSASKSCGASRTHSTRSSSNLAMRTLSGDSCNKRQVSRHLIMLC